MVNKDNHLPSCATMQPGRVPVIYSALPSDEENFITLSTSNNESLQSGVVVKCSSLLGKMLQTVSLPQGYSPTVVSYHLVHQNHYIVSRIELDSLLCRPQGQEA